MDDKLQEIIDILEGKRKPPTPYYDATLEYLKLMDDNHKDQTKSKGLEYTYLTQRREFRRHIKEIPISNLTNKQKKKCEQSHIDIDWE